MDPDVIVFVLWGGVVVIVLCVMGAFIHAALHLERYVGSRHDPLYELRETRREARK